MKNKIMSNLWLKILSIVVAFLFWVVIINVTDPTTEKTFYNIPVQILNENVITSVNQVYEIESGDHIQVSVKGKRSFVETLTASDFVATADLSELSKVNAASIDVKLKRTPQSNVDVDWGNAVLKVKLEKRISKKFKVQVEHQGELSEDYELGEVVAKPNIVEVSCGESKFKKIDHVGVVVALNGESEDFERTYSPILYDEDGDILDNNNVTFSNDAITVSTRVLQTKEIPVYVNVTGTPADGYQLVQTDYQPETIRISGKPEDLKKNISIRIPVSIEKAKKVVEKEAVLSDYLTPDVSIVGDVTTVSIRCDIEKNGRRSFVLTSTDIAVKNLPKDCTMDFTEADTKYQLMLSGDEADLKNLTLNNLGAYVDLSGLSTGVHTLEVNFQLPDGVTTKNKIKVKVTLTSQSTAMETPSPTATPEVTPEAE
ncbi:MAG: hypothetical protein J5988_02630 [Eubacterium sp.]|nr:hypothetical protein [Eubacterium sp.]